MAPDIIKPSNLSYVLSVIVFRNLNKKYRIYTLIQYSHRGIVILTDKSLELRWILVK